MPEYAISSKDTGYWQKVSSKTIRGAKCRATTEFGHGLNSDTLQVSEIIQEDITGCFHKVVAEKPNCPGGQWRNC